MHQTKIRDRFQFQGQLSVPSRNLPKVEQEPNALVLIGKKIHILINGIVRYVTRLLELYLAYIKIAGRDIITKDRVAVIIMNRSFRKTT